MGFKYLHPFLLSPTSFHTTYFSVSYLFTVSRTVKVYFNNLLLTGTSNSVVNITRLISMFFIRN